MVSIIFQAKMSNICWLQLLKCDDLLVFESLGFEQLVGQNYLKTLVWAQFGIVMSIFHNCLTRRSQIN